MNQLEMTDSQIERLVIRLYELYSEQLGVKIILNKKENKKSTSRKDSKCAKNTR